MLEDTTSKGRWVRVVAVLLVMAALLVWPLRLHSPDSVHAGSSCIGLADIVLVLDNSQSINSEELADLKTAAHTIVDAIGPNTTQGVVMGITRFRGSSASVVEMTDEEAPLHDGISDLIQGGQSLDSYTNIVLGLQGGADQFSTGLGDQPIGSNLIILITDGNDNMGNSLRDIKAASAATEVEVFAIGVGADVSIETLNAIATDPDGDHVFYVEDFGELVNDIREIAAEACPAPTVTIDQAVGQDDPTGISPVKFTVVFSEDVTGFTGTDLALTGSAGPSWAIVTGGPAIYEVSVTGMTKDGTVIASVIAGAAISATGKGNLISTSTDNQVTYDTTLLNADLSVTKAADRVEIAEEDSLVYIITVTNDGPATARGVTLADAMPSGVSFVSAMASQGSFTSGTGEWDVGDLSSGDRATLMITVIANAGTGGTTIANSVQVTAVGLSDPDSVNNSDAVNITVIPAPTLTVTKIVINDDGGTADAVDFTLRVDGDVVASGVASTLSAGTHVVSEDDPSPGYIATIGGDCAPDGTISLNPGENKVCTITNDDVAPIPTATPVPSPTPTPTPVPQPTATPVPPTAEPAAFPVEGEVLPEPGSSLSWWAWILVGLGIVAAVTATGRLFLPYFPFIR